METIYHNFEGKSMKKVCKIERDKDIEKKGTASALSLCVSKIGALSLFNSI